jgi:hypothetical protein
MTGEEELPLVFAPPESGLLRVLRGLLSVAARRRFAAPTIHEKTLRFRGRWSKPAIFSRFFRFRVAISQQMLLICRLTARFIQASGLTNHFHF